MSARNRPATRASRGCVCAGGQGGRQDGPRDADADAQGEEGGGAGRGGEGARAQAPGPAVLCKSTKRSAASGGMGGRSGCTNVQELSAAVFPAKRWPSNALVPPSNAFADPHACDPYARFLCPPPSLCPFPFPCVRSPTHASCARAPPPSLCPFPFPCPVERLPCDASNAFPVPLRRRPAPLASPPRKLPPPLPVQPPPDLGSLQLALKLALKLAMLL
eukprot:43895-Chlamydomonas_euryale.AAC.14